MNPPTPEQIKQRRESLAMSQPEAAKLIYRSASAWQKWEYGERTMPLALWELFLHKTEQQQ